MRFNICATPTGLWVWSHQTNIASDVFMTKRQPTSNPPDIYTSPDVRTAPNGPN